MSLTACLIMEQPEGWLVAAGNETESLSPDVSTSELVSCAQLVSKLAGVKNPKCVLAPSSNSCFFAALRVGSDIDVRDRTALVFELEDHLPIDAESMVADFAVLPTADVDKTVAAVAIETARWREIADAFESAGIPVSAIVPSAVLATRSVCKNFRFTDAFDLLLVRQSQCDLLKVRSETIIGWKHTQLEATQLRRNKLLDADGFNRVVVVGADESQASVIQQQYGEVQDISGTVESHVADGAEMLFAKDSQRWFNLRRDQLGPSDPLRPIQSHLRLVTIATLACLLAVIAGGWWRTQRIENEIAEVRNRQSELFAEAFPNTRIPGALLRRVRSEHARVVGSRGVSSQIDLPQSAPEILRTLLKAFPSDVRFRIERLQILNGTVDIDFQVRVPTDAGKLAIALESAGFDVKPPVTTQKDAKTFDSLLEAIWIGSSESPMNQDARTRHSLSARILLAAEVQP